MGAEHQSKKCNNVEYKYILEKNKFPSQSLKIFTFRVKLSDSIFFLLGHSPPNFILFQLDFDVKFPLLRLLLFLIDLKSTILCHSLFCWGLTCHETLNSVINLYIQRICCWWKPDPDNRPLPVPPDRSYGASSPAYLGFWESIYKAWETFNRSYAVQPSQGEDKTGLMINWLYRI